jgi:hypothetical protein
MEGDEVEGRRLSGDKASALAVLAALALAAAGLLMVPLRLPIGPNHWDLYFILDGAWRMSMGQAPHVDFHVPSGFLPYALSAVAQALFPAGHPLLATQYGVLIIALPLMALAVLNIAGNGRWLALFAAAPFVILVLSPSNAQTLTAWAGSDGLGLYNRQSNHLAYVLMVALALMRDGPARAVVIGVALTALFYTKINVFLPLAALTAYAVLPGLLGVRTALAAAGLCGALVLAVGFGSGLLLPYLSDFAALLRYNSGGLVSRVVTLVSVRLEVVLPLALLSAALLWRDAPALWRACWQAVRGAGDRLAPIRGSLARPGPWFLACAAVAVAVEAQNTGSQEFVFLWPALLGVLVGGAAPLLDQPPGAWRRMVLILVAAVTLPTLLAVVQRTARFALAGAGYPAVEAPLLRRLDTGSVKRDNLDHARAALELYASARPSFAAFAEAGQMPSPMLYSEPSFQALHLIDLQGALEAVLALEAREGRRFATIAVLDSVDLAAYALQRAPAKGLAVSIDLWRGLPRDNWPALIEGWRRSEALLMPHCPETPLRRQAAAMAQPVLAGRTLTPLNACWTIAVAEGVR